MRTIEGTYYDGKSSTPNSVEVTLNTRSIYIRGLDPDAFPKIEQTWLVETLEDIDFTSSDTVHLKYGNFPHESLIIKNKEDVQYFREFYPEVGNTNLYRNVLSGNVYKVVGISFGLLVAVVGVYMFFVAPYVAEKAVRLVPPSMEITLGEKMTEHLFASMSFDDEKSEILKEFFDEIGLKSTYPIKLHYEESSMVNAFAVPGGKIVVFDGIVDKMDNWEELAGLLGHELAHVEQRHSLKAMSRSLSTYIVFSVMTGDVSGFSAVIIENSRMLTDLANSRSAETEADEIGMGYLLDNDIDPHGMIDLFEILQGESGGMDAEGKTKKLMQIMSTHPLTEDRIEFLTKASEKYSDREFPENERAQELFERLKE